VHPGLLQKLGIEKRVYFAELNLHELLDLHPKHLKVADLPLYPSSERDWTLPLRKETPVQKVLDFLQEEKSPLLEKAFLLDLFEGDPLGKDQKNATYRLIYRDQTKTLDFDTVEKEHASLTEKTLQKLCDYI